MPTMKAIQISAPGTDFELVNREIPEPNAGELLIKVQACGVCHGEAILKGGHFPVLRIREFPDTRLSGQLVNLVPM